LEGYRKRNPIVLGLPRGGVAVAAEVASALDAPLDVVVAHKIGAPFQPELAVGAIAPKGIVVLDERFPFSEESLQTEIEAQRHEMRRRIQRFQCAPSDLPDVKGRTAIVVDDGLATGLTMYAAVLALRTAEPAEIVVALPVGSTEGVTRLSSVVDEVVCLETPPDLDAIGAWYLDFDQVSDDEVEAFLQTSRDAAKAAATSDRLRS
jgi:predicted phosphoribosyltransferase